MTPSAPGRTPRRLAAGAILAVAAAGLQGAGLAQTAAPATVATIDFRAIAEGGRPVLDLAPGDVTIRVAGRQRELRSLELVRTTDTRAGAPASRRPAFATNAAPSAGRVVLLVVDDETIRPGREQPVRDAVGQLLTRLAPGDQVGVVTVPHGGIRQNLTDDHSRVRAAVQGLVGQAPREIDPNVEGCRSQRTLQALRGLLDSLTPGDAPTTLVLFSSSLTGPSDAEPTQMRTALPSAPGTPVSTKCVIRLTEYQEVGAAASRAHANFYVVAPEDVMVAPGSYRPEDLSSGRLTGAGGGFAGLEFLTGATGGELFVLSGMGEGTLARLAIETSAHYVATFVPEASERTGNAYRLDVRVGREGVTVRARSSVTIPAAEARGRPALTARDLLRDSREHRDLPMRGAGFVSRGEPEGPLKVIGIFEPSGLPGTLTSAAAGLFDEAGRLVAQWTAQADELQARPVIAALAAPPGTYRLRFAAVDGTGRTGTVDQELPVTLNRAGAFSMSGLILGLVPDGSFHPRLLFEGEPVAVAYVEVYGAGVGRISAAIELARTEEGAALVAGPAALNRTRDETFQIVTGGLPIDTLPPGDYTVRIVISFDGQPIGRVARTLRKGDR